MTKKYILIVLYFFLYKYRLVSATGVCKNMVRPLEIHRSNFKPRAGVNATVQDGCNGA